MYKVLHKILSFTKIGRDAHCWNGNGNQETPYECQWRFGSCLSCIFELLRNGVSTYISVKYFCHVRHPSTSVRYSLGYAHLGCGNMT